MTREQRIGLYILTAAAIVVILAVLFSLYGEHLWPVD